MGGRKSHAAFMADAAERNPFDLDETEADCQDTAQDTTQDVSPEGRGIQSLPDLPLGSEFQHIDASGARWLKRIFVPATAAAGGNEEHDDHYGDAKLHARFVAANGMATDAQAGWRPMIAANAGMISALDDLSDGAPNFRKLFDFVLAGAKASLHAGMPFRIPPVLLLGPPGAGKSRAASLIADCLATTIEKVPITLQTGAGVLSGLDTSWRSPKLGAVARVLLASKTACPIILFDEIDKSNPRSEYGQLLDPLHDLLEQDTARSFVDDYLRVPLAADAIIWLSTANDAQNIPAPILDRMLVVEVTQPTEAEMGVILSAMIRAAMARWGQWFDESPAVITDTIAVLRTVHPRAARRVIDLAAGFAVAAERRVILSEDVEHARKITINPKSTMKIGFL